MARHAGATPLPPITLDASRSTPLYRQVYERVRGEMLAGKLLPGTRLPSSRALTSELGVARNTAALAYQLLALEGYLEGRVGDGTRVARLRG